jgi:hypothetical protein
MIMDSSDPTKIPKIGAPIAGQTMEVYSDDESPKAKTIHVIMRPEKNGEVVKISEIEKKNMKK